MRKAAKIDENQVSIVSDLRKAGALVLSLAAVGKGCADLLVYRCGRLSLLELKNPDMPPSKRRLTKDQISFHRFWPVTVVTTIEEAIAATQGDHRR